mmetsp:Transcript_28373/g.71208  ORF Transcript_28373/g.71208 Transcript_28373/m.71208 type:complete len:89 (+) Transcript_28373:204-470(+)|eukprot:CAMPEP_0174894314 /NCGR_PEP_ID=MMETSP0167-20121228/8970_1 /TAXON_ID=38298 /ORGANISM="Rhodella maculata, Strain CCMP736" /LENGTH=88 /DNA_ID=CAMNT_0016133359 /DNA_START=183 /DNA_END=449 /DNA_ORIENTATION=+
MEETRTNHQWFLQAHPDGTLNSSLFEKRSESIADVNDGQVLAEVLHLSFDPTQRTWIEMDTYVPQVGLGETMRAFGVAQVVASKHASF